jgi:hypothetical protein
VGTSPAVCAGRTQATHEPPMCVLRLVPANARQRGAYCILPAIYGNVGLAGARNPRGAVTSLSASGRTHGNRRRDSEAFSAAAHHDALRRRIRPSQRRFLLSRQHRNDGAHEELAFGKSDDFLRSFQAYGWYLDDLVLEPIDHLPKVQLLAKCREAQESLANRIETYQPEAIVSLLKRIEPFVNGAATMAHSNVPRYCVPFPGMGQQQRFQDAMAAIIQKLPRFP